MVAALIVVIIISMSGGSNSTKTIDEVSPAVVAAFENDKSEKSPERVLKKNFGFNASDFDGVVLYSPISNMDAEELLIVKLADEEQADELIEAIETRVASQMNIYDGYAPEQYNLCQNAIIDQQGNYILYVVHENAVNIDSIFRAALK